MENNKHIIFDVIIPVFQSVLRVQIKQSRKSKSFKHFAKAKQAQGAQMQLKIFSYPLNRFSDAPRAQAWIRDRGTSGLDLQHFRSNS